MIERDGPMEQQQEDEALLNKTIQLRPVQF